MVAAVGPDAGENLVAHDAGLERLPGRREGLGRDGAFGLGIGNHFGERLILERGAGFAAGQLARGLLGGAEGVVVFRPQDVAQSVGRRRFIRPS